MAVKKRKPSPAVQKKLDEIKTANKKKKKAAKKKATKKRPSRKTRPQPKTETNPNGAGAQQVVIDWTQVDALCQIQCTGEEIASVLKVDYDTLVNACKREHEMKFSEYIRQKGYTGKASLRRRQWKAAIEEGNVTMLIWLGKNMLDQKDKQELTGPNNGPIQTSVVFKGVAGKK